MCRGGCVSPWFRNASPILRSVSMPPREEADRKNWNPSKTKNQSISRDPCPWHTKNQCVILGILTRTRNLPKRGCSSLRTRRPPALRPVQISYYKTETELAKRKRKKGTCNLRTFKALLQLKSCNARCNLIYAIKELRCPAIVESNNQIEIRWPNN